MLKLTKEDIIQKGDECQFVHKFDKRDVKWKPIDSFWFGLSAGKIMAFLGMRCRRPEPTDKT